MYAIVDIKGKQFKVEKDQTLNVPKLNEKVVINMKSKVGRRIRDRKKCGERNYNCVVLNNM